MLFSNSLNTTMKDLRDLGTYSYVVSQALGRIKSPIQAIQSADTPEPWGVSSTHHNSAYGRHLFYISPSSGIIPFWIGLSVSAKGTEIAVTFDRKLLNALGKISAIQALPGTHSCIPGYCNVKSGNTVLIEINLAAAELTQFRNNPDPQILADFLDEVLGVL